MVGLDDGAVSEPGLYDIRVDRPLGEEVHCSDLLRLLLENADKLLSDNSPLLLRLLHSLQLLQIQGTGIDADKVQIVLSRRPEDGLHLIPLVLSKQAMVHKNAAELSPDRLGQKRRCDGAVHAAGEREQDLPSADLLPDRLDLV